MTIITHSAQAEPKFYSPSNLQILHIPPPQVLWIYHKAILDVKWLKCKLSSRLKKKKRKINFEQTICNTEDWLFFLLKSGWKYFTHSHSHILSHLKKITHTQLKNGIFLLGGGEVLVWVKKGVYS